MASMPSNPRRPGIMLVHPRLKDPSPENAAKFLRWTKLHFRDMLNMPSDPKLGKITRSLRFTAPVDDEKYSFEPGKQCSPYLYTCHLDDVGVVQTEPYYAISRRLDLENTRELSQGEEAVGQEGMVWDVVNAEFAIYEEMVGVVPTNTSVSSYQTLQLPLTTSHGKPGLPPPTHLIALNINPQTPNPSPQRPVSQLVLELRASLLTHLAPLCKPTSSFKLHTSLYRHAGSGAQPEMHPEVNLETKGKWLLIVLLAGEEGESGAREDIVGWLELWIDAVREVMEEKGVGISWGVWGGEVLMS